MQEFTDGIRVPAYVGCDDIDHVQLRICRVVPPITRPSHSPHLNQKRCQHLDRLFLQFSHAGRSAVGLQLGSVTTEDPQTRFPQSKTATDVLSPFKGIRSAVPLSTRTSAAASHRTETPGTGWAGAFSPTPTCNETLICPGSITHVFACTRPLAQLDTILPSIIHGSPADNTTQGVAGCQSAGSISRPIRFLFVAEDHHSSIV